MSECPSREWMQGLQECTVELRDLVAEYERQFRPFPPRSGSVSKPFPAAGRRSPEIRRTWLTGEQMGRLPSARAVEYVVILPGGEPDPCSPIVGARSYFPVKLPKRINPLEGEMNDIPHIPTLLHKAMSSKEPVLVFEGQEKNDLAHEIGRMFQGVSIAQLLNADRIIAKLEPHPDRAAQARAAGRNWYFE